MTRHQRHIRLLNHLHQYGYVLTWVSNGASVCRGKIVGTPSNPYHRFGMSKKFDKATPPLVQIKKGMTPHLSFRVEGKDGEVQYLLGWKYLAAFVQILDMRKQKEESGKAKEEVA